MQISRKREHDSVADLYLYDEVMLVALRATEEIAGKPGMKIILREAGLERLIDNYPRTDVAISRTLTYGDYANLNAALINFFGRAGKSIVVRIGRTSAKYSMDGRGTAIKVMTSVVSKLLPLPTQVKMVLEMQQRVFRNLSKSVDQLIELSLADHTDKMIYTAGHCLVCAGKQADLPMCMLLEGYIHESMTWTTGKDFAVKEVACRATGAPACVFEISKTPIE